MEVSWNRGTPKWMVYKGKSHLEMDDLGVPRIICRHLSSSTKTSFNFWLEFAQFFHTDPKFLKHVPFSSIYHHLLSHIIPLSQFTIIWIIYHLFIFILISTSSIIVYALSNSNSIDLVIIGQSNTRILSLVPNSQDDLFTPLRVGGPPTPQAFFWPTQTYIQKIRQKHCFLQCFYNVFRRKHRDLRGFSA